MTAEFYLIAFLLVVGAFSVVVVRALGWHWLAVWPVFSVAFFGLIYVGFVVSEAGGAFVKGFKRGFKRGRGE